MKGNSKAVAERCREQAGAGCRADQRESFQAYLLSAGNHSLPDHEVKLIVLHRGVKLLFNRRVETMYLVDEKHITFLQISQLANQITRYFNRRASSRMQHGAHFVRDNIRQGGFTKSGRTR